MAVPQVIYSPEARADLLAIETYIAVNDGDMRAELIIGRLDEAILNLAYMPGMGRLRRYLEPGVRAFAVSPWVIVYELLPSLDGIIVLRVIDGRRDLDTVLAKGKRSRQRRTR